MIADVILTAMIPVMAPAFWKVFGDLSRTLRAKHALEQAVLTAAAGDQNIRTTLSEATRDPARLADASALVSEVARSLEEPYRAAAQSALSQGERARAPVYVGDIVRHVAARLPNGLEQSA